MTAENTLDCETLTLDSGAKVVVPATPSGMTRFVLQEQGEWFEPELAFVPSILTDDSCSIDVGANYGLYTLALAHHSRPDGQVVAIEPTPSTAACLRATVDANQLTGTTVWEMALSKESGQTQLHTYPNSELNTLGGAGVKPGAVVQTVKVRTLDDVYAELGWSRLDFLKLDAEGEEQRIAEGGRQTLEATDPLLLFELKHGGNLNTPLIDLLGDWGYVCYRLIPELGALTPFDQSRPLDRFQLNLFCCKAPRADALRASGLLLDENPPPNLPDPPPALPWVQDLPEPAGVDQAIFRACQVDADPTADAADRWASLHGVRAAVAQRLGDRAAPLELLSTAARVAFASGERALGVDLLAALIQRIQGGEPFVPRYRFFPATKRFDAIPVPENLRDWFVASALERYLKEHAFSAYFSRNKSAAILRYLTELGFADPALLRRASALERLQQAVAQA